MAAFSRLVREPVVQFLAAGGVLFAVYLGFAPPAEMPPERIVLSAARIEALAGNFQRTWRRTPSPAELDGIISDYIAEEVLYREALKLGLDRDDEVVRRRMGQKMEILLSETLAASPADDVALRAFFEAEKDRYRRPGRWSFEQVFLGPDARETNTDWPTLVRQMNAGSEVDLASVGTSSLLPPTMSEATPQVIEGTFGADFTTSVTRLSPGFWAGPVASAYGLHLVRVTAREPGESPDFSEVRAEVARDLAYQQRRAGKAELVERLSRDYDISIAPEDR